MCTRVLWNENSDLTVVGRSMDWPVSTEPKIVVWSKDVERNGGELEGQQVVDREQALLWKSKYASIGVSIYGLATIDGMNEKGLAAHGLYLKSTQLPDLDENKKTIHIGMWVQYVLDLAATVSEAIDLVKAINVTMIEARGTKATIHLAIEDASGDSAIVEYVNGELVIHHNRDYVIMTNDPPYDQQLALLHKQDFSHPNKDLPLPGNVNPIDRFQRAAYYRALLPKTSNEREAVAGVLAIMRNVSVPFGAPYGEFGIYDTEYRTVADLTNRRYFFELSTSPSVIWVDLQALLPKLQQKALLTLNPDDITLNGDVTAHL